MKQLLLSLLFIATVAHKISAQEVGSILGKLTDTEANNEPLAFANVIIKGTSKGTTSDFDGLYELGGLEPGTYTVVFSFLGYETVEIPDVSVVAGNVTTLDIPMSASQGVSLDEVVITVQARKDSEVALLLDQKQAVEIKESIGAQQLAKIGVTDVAVATTKISGVSSSEASGDIFIRGLGDRYLSTTLNGLTVPSDDVERKNIDLGLFTTRVIQNVSVSKTYDVGTSADQSSGNVNITSRELAGNSELRIGLQSGFNTNVLSNGVYGNFKVSPNSNNTDFGFYKQNLTTQELITAQGWNTVKRENPINYRLSIAGGTRIAEKLALFASASHSQKYEYGEGIFRQFRSNFIDDTITDATNWREEIVTSGLLDLTYFINDKNKLKSSTFFINTLNEEVYEGGRNGEGFIFEETDPAEGLGQFIRDQNTKQTRLIVTQLIGTHQLGDKNTLHWAGGYNLVNADEPNRIRNEVNFDPNSDFVQLGRTGGFQQRKSSQTIEDVEYNGFVKDEFRIKEDGPNPMKLEFGVNFRTKERDFRSEFVGVEERATNTINPPSIDNLGAIFQQSNFDSGDLQLNLLQPDLYVGNLDSQAAFADFNIGFEKFNADLGLRYQRDQIDVAFDVGNFPGRVGESIKEYDNLYPSLNLKYDLNEKQALRFAFSRTITLPEFKEIAPFEYVSQVGQVTRGNPDLEASTDLNFDLKWEFFPSNDQLVSVAAFYKNISDPINRAQDRGSAGVFSYFNTGNTAEVFGLEAETKLKLISAEINEDTYVPSTSALNLVFNVTRMWHSQDLKEVFDEEGNFVRTFRYKGLTEEGLEGASDWILNASLNFTSPGENPFNASLTANYASDKIFAIGAPEIQSASDEFYNDAIVEKGFVVLDAVISKEFNEHWRIRFIGRNLLNPSIERTQLVKPSTTGIETEELVRSYTRGAQINLGLSYTF